VLPFELWVQLRHMPLPKIKINSRNKKVLVSVVLLVAIGAFVSFYLFLKVKKSKNFLEMTYEEKAVVVDNYINSLQNQLPANLISTQTNPNQVTIERNGETITADFTDQLILDCRRKDTIIGGFSVYNLGVVYGNWSVGGKMKKIEQLLQIPMEKKVQIMKEYSPQWPLRADLQQKKSGDYVLYSASVYMDNCDWMKL